VLLGFESDSYVDPKTRIEKRLPDGNGGTYSFRDNMSWYLPPELGACAPLALDLALGKSGGHAVNIVGYSVAGSLANPDPFNSYFVIENNWGKFAGYNSFFFMNFAAFRYLADSVTTYRLDAQCWSEACETRPSVSIPATALSRFEYPPDPSGAQFQRYQGLMQQFLPFLSGHPTFSGKPPFMPGSAPLVNVFPGNFQQ